MINKIRSQETGGPVVKISNLAAIPAVRFPAPAAGPPGRTPALALVPFMAASRLRADTVLFSTHSGHPSALPGLRSLREVFPGHPSPGSPAPSGLTEGSEVLTWAPPPNTGTLRRAGCYCRCLWHPVCACATRAFRSELFSISAVDVCGCVILGPGPSWAP